MARISISEISMDAQVGTRIRGLDPIKLRDATSETAEIRQMKTGQSGYIVPWALTITRDGNLYVNGTFWINSKCESTCVVRVEREGQEPDGFSIDLSLVDKEGYKSINKVESIDVFVGNDGGVNLKDMILIGNIKELVTPQRRS